MSVPISPTASIAHPIGPIAMDIINFAAIINCFFASMDINRFPAAIIAFFCARTNAFFCAIPASLRCAIIIPIVVTVCFPADHVRFAIEPVKLVVFIPPNSNNIFFVFFPIRLNAFSDTSSPA